MLRRILLFFVAIYDAAEEESARGRGPSVVGSVWNRRSQTNYVAPARIEGNGYSVDFGRFGSVDVHYEERPRRTVEDCRGRKQKEEQWRFTGTVDFHGDRHFTESDYPYLDTRGVSQYESNCFLVGEGGRGAALDGLSKYGVTRVFANGTSGRVRFQVDAKYILGPMLIYRNLQVFGPSSDFVRSERFSSARITPPAPFHGSASYHVFPKSHEYGRWRGNLTFDFPGFPHYPLTARPTLGILKPGGCKVFSAKRRVGPPVLCL